MGSRVGHISVDQRVERCAQTADFPPEDSADHGRVSSLGTLRLRPLAARQIGRRIAPSLVPSECRFSVGPALPATPASSGGKTPVHDNLARPADREMSAGGGVPAPRTQQTTAESLRSQPRGKGCFQLGRPGDASHRVWSRQSADSASAPLCPLPLLVGKHLSVTISLDLRVERCAQTADFPRTTLQTTAESLPSQPRGEGFSQPDRSGDASHRVWSLQMAESASAPLCQIPLLVPMRKHRSVTISLDRRVER